MTDCEQNIIGDNMSLVIIRAFIIYVFVIVAVRIMGKRQVGELKPHEACNHFFNKFHSHNSASG